MRPAWHLGFLAVRPTLQEIPGSRLVARALQRRKKWRLRPKNFEVAKVLVWTLQAPLRQQALAHLGLTLQLETRTWSIWVDRLFFSLLG